MKIYVVFGAYGIQINPYIFIVIKLLSVYLWLFVVLANFVQPLKKVVFKQYINLGVSFFLSISLLKWNIKTWICVQTERRGILGLCWTASQ